MNSKTPLSAVACAAVWASALVAASIAPAADQSEHKAVAEKIVGQCANVKEGDRVVVRGDVRDLDLIEEITLAVTKRGAEAIQIVGRESSARRYYDEVPAKYDSIPLSLSLKLAGVETVDIAIEGQEFPGLLSDVTPARFAANGKRLMEVLDVRLKGGVRSVSVGNGLYPTDATAKNLGLTKKQLSRLFWEGINVDYGALQATGAKLRGKLASGKEVHVTHRNGTDFKVRIEGRPVFVSDGVISPEDVAKGGPAVQVWLPAGEVYVTPVPGTAEGKIVFDHIPFEAGELQEAVFTIKAGKLTAHSAKPSTSYDRWKALYEAAPSGKDDFAYVDVGMNSNIKVPPGSKLTSWVPAGTVSLGCGGNTWAGGSNSDGWSAGGSINGCTLTIDGDVIVERGELKIR